MRDIGISFRKAAIVFTLSLICLVITLYLRISTFDEIVKKSLGSDRILLSSDGQIVQTLRIDYHKRRLAWHSLTSFPKSLQAAVIASEDRRFYSHSGIDLIGLSRAVWADLRRKPVQGASTLTMQVTDLIQDDVLNGNRTIVKGSVTHKIVQIMRSLLLEARWTKPQILEAYLNLIHLRGEYQGVPALAQAYLHKDPEALDDAESMVIASMISSPNQGLSLLSKRACSLQARMANQGDTEPLVNNDSEPLVKAASEFFNGAPSLTTSEGYAPLLARRLFQENPGDAIVHSTLDLALQRDVKAILEKNIARLSGENVRDSAAIVIDNKTGHVLAYVGGVSTSENPHVDGVQAYRQAGSSLKPFFYGRAIESKSLTAASILLDEPTAISWGGDVYRPTNYDKHFYGPVSVREALGSSLNVPAVKTITVIGLHQAYHVLQSAHFSNLKEPDYYGVSMALGAVEVRLDELANAYRIYANAGVWSPLKFVNSKPTADQTDRVYSPETAYIMSSILSDADARSIGFGWENPIETPFWTAVKTGTSKDYRDNWCAGFSERYTVAVWAGNFNAEAMHKVSGVSGAGPSWFEIMTRLHRNVESRAPAMPSGVVARNVRHSWASHEHREYFIQGTEPASGIIEPSLVKSPKFVFPAEGSILVRDPHIDQSRIALFVRFNGIVPEKSRLLLDGRDVGEAKSPFKLTEFRTGNHDLWIDSADNTTIAKVHFRVKGADSN